MSQMLLKADQMNLYKEKFTTKQDREKEFLYSFNCFLQSFVKSHGKMCGYIALALLVDMPPFETMLDLKLWVQSNCNDLYQALITLQNNNLTKTLKASSKFFPNEDLPQLFQKIEDWWIHDLDPLKQQIVKRHTLSKFFKRKLIINDDKEFDPIFKAINDSKDLIQDEYVKRSEFMRIMSIGIMQ
jgi:hypothetical protein